MRAAKAWQRCAKHINELSGAKVQKLQEAKEGAALGAIENVVNIVPLAEQEQNQDSSS